MRFLILSTFFLLAACVTAAPSENASLRLQPASFHDLPGWDNDSQDLALTAFAQSCATLLKQAPEKPFGADPLMGRIVDWQAPCRAAPQVTAGNARIFFETWFMPWQVTAEGDSKGLFTGYYEASLHGSRTRHNAYQYPLRLRPSDLVMVELGDFRPELKGQRIAGLVEKGQLKPYPDRAAIAQAGLPGDAKTIFVWVDDPVDAFFLQIQGSGRIALDDGTSLRVGYDAQNGWPYTAIGRELIHRGALDKDHVSMQTIRAWLKAHPDQADSVMNVDRSYIFFKILGSDGPLGGEGVVLTPGRSLAIDHARLPYGAPVWVDAAAPASGEPIFRRLMIAQDTGGAIRGAVRGDVFWGYGAQAETLAGAMKSTGQDWLLLPKSVTTKP